VKIAILADTHFGVRNDNKDFLDYFEKFYRDVFFPTCIEHNVFTVLHAGDLVDRRKNINFVTLQRMKQMFLQPLDELNINLQVILGNHDVYYKNTNQVNALRGLLDEWELINVIEEPTVQDYDGVNFCLLPWLNVENQEASLEFVSKAKATHLLGHLELKGFVMHGTQVSEHGLGTEPFKNFELVMSGHYHHKSQQGNILYLGAPYQMTWNDYGDPCGFHLFDTETRELTFVQNPYEMFVRLPYNDKGKSMEETLQFLNTAEKFNRKHVKIFIEHKENELIFEKFLDKLNSTDPQKVQIVDNSIERVTISDDDIVGDAEDTLSILTQYIESLQSDHEKQLKDVLKSLYAEAVDNL